MYESQASQLSNARLNLETQLMSLESASTLQAMQSMKLGASSLRSLQYINRIYISVFIMYSSKMSVDNVDDIMDDIQEQMDMSNEIGEALSAPIEEGFDEDDLLVKFPV